MTTVVFVEKPGRVEIAFDSKVSMGSRHQELSGLGKVFKVGPVTFGGAGSLSYLNAISEIHIPPVQEMSADETDRWVSRVLMPKIRGAANVHNPMSPFGGGTILVAINGRVYEIGGDFSNLRLASGQYAIGSGSSYALGALANGASAKRAVEVAASYDVFTGHTIRELTIKK